MADKKSVIFVGARGIGNYGGFETFVKEVAPLLHDRGLEVHCTCERDGKNIGGEYRGAILDYFPLRPPVNYSARKVFEVIYDAYFLLRSPSYSDDIFLLGTLGAPFLIIPRMLGKHVHVNIDGMEWRRDKFSWIERTLLKMTFKISLIFANSIIIDSRQLRTEIPDDAQDKVVYIAYGVDPQNNAENKPEMKTRLDELGIKEKGYWLVIARLEPENNIHTIVEAFGRSGSNYPMIVVGKFTSPEYEREVRSMANDVIFLGHVYDPEWLAYLRHNCFAYIHGHSVGGTNPSLLEAMASDLIIVAHDNGFNREVMDDAGLYFESVEALISIIRLVENGPADHQSLAKRAKDRVHKNYTWSDIADAYKRLTDR